MFSSSIVYRLLSGVWCLGLGLGLRLGLGLGLACILFRHALSGAGGTKARSHRL